MIDAQEPRHFLDLLPDVACRHALGQHGQTTKLLQIEFNGTCREAMNAYARIFGTAPPDSSGEPSCGRKPVR